MTGVLGVWPPLPPGAFVSRRKPLPFPLDDPRCRIYSRARQGLVHAIEALGFGAGDIALVPAYHHGSEIEAWLQSGVECRFYDIGDDAQPDEDALMALIDPNVKALHITHFLGFPQDVVKWRAFCDRSGLALVEDVAQGWLGTIDGRPLGSFGDAAIFCLYKFFGVPDGGAVVADGIDGARDPGDRGWGRAMRRMGAWVAGRSGLATKALYRRHDESENASIADDVAVTDRDRGPRGSTMALLPRVYSSEAPARRRANYSYLAAALSDLVPDAFRRLPDGACPFAFPIAIEYDKQRVHSALAARGIDAQNFWTVPHPSLPANRFPVSDRLRETVLALPVHQELRRSDIRAMVEAVRDVYRIERIQAEQTSSSISTATETLVGKRSGRRSR